MWDLTSHLHCRHPKPSHDHLSAGLLKQPLPGSLCFCPSPPQPVINTSSQRIILTPKLDQITFLLTFLQWFPSHSVQKPESSLWPTKTRMICLHLLPTLITPYPSPHSFCSSCTRLLAMPWALQASFHLRTFALAVLSAWYAFHPNNCSVHFLISRLYSNVTGPLSTILTLSQHFLFPFFYLDVFHALATFWQTRYFTYFFLPVSSTRSAPQGQGFGLFCSWLYSPVFRIVSGTH